MRPVTVLGSTLAVLMLGNACTTNSSGTATSRYGSTQPAPVAGVASYGQIGDSIIAQALADREGPRVTIHAQISNAADSRRVRGVFRLEDDAYVIVGHIDADGVLRIAFPNDPTDDGFVRGSRPIRPMSFSRASTASIAFARVPRCSTSRGDARRIRRRTRLRVRDRVVAANAFRAVPDGQHVGQLRADGRQLHARSASGDLRARDAARRR